MKAHADHGPASRVVRKLQKWLRGDPTSGMREGLRFGQEKAGKVPPATGIGKGWPALPGPAGYGPWLCFLHRGAGPGEDNGGVGLPSHSGGAPLYTSAQRAAGRPDQH